MKPEHAVRLQIGEFEFDLKTGELRPVDMRRGEGRVVLQEQPFRVLQMLVERGGEIATRDEIKKKLWPNDTIVDFDHSINVAIGTLRRALGDSADQPKYIETVARRGYRLVAPIQRMKVDDKSVASRAVDKAEGASGLFPSLSGFLVGKVSHYRVLEIIGGGGMGMVYKAEDLKLGRCVAVKFLPEEMSTDPISLRRFEREAQTASSLNHPGICTVFEIEEYEHQPFIVMELLEGETLRDRLNSGESKTIPLDQLLEIARQTCEALQAAHDKGIVHRDIKPANIFLTKQGMVKILDFGLAKLVSAEAPSESEKGRPVQIVSSGGSARAVDLTLTRGGSAMGTASYMSPEQVQKEKLDARSDLFSFGLVLYEMATGHRAFVGDDVTTVHDAILNQQPIPVRELNSATPPSLGALIAKALEKDREGRYQCAGDMRKELELVGDDGLQRSRSLGKWVTAAALLLVVAFGGWLYWRARAAMKLSAEDTIVLAELSNHTSDSVFDSALNTALRVEFEQTPFLHVLAADKVRGNLKALNHPVNTKITAEIAREVCLRTNSKALVDSSIADAGNYFRIELRGVSCKTGKTFAQTVQFATSRNDIIHELGEAGNDLRRKMGEPSASLNRFQKPLDVATSSSIDALQLLTLGYQRHFFTDRSSISYYQRAVDVDPSFALAYAALGAKLFMLDEALSASAAAKKAYELRDRLTEQDRYEIESMYFDLGTGEIEKARETFKEWAATFPEDVRAHINYASSLRFLGEFGASAAEAREAARLWPAPPTYLALAISTALANRLNDAKAVFEEAKARGFDIPEQHANLHFIAFLQKDRAGMEEQLSWAKGKKDAENLLLRKEADTQAYYGHFRKAREMSQKANSLSTDTPNDSAKFPLSESLREVEAGNLTEGKRYLAEIGHNKLNQDRRLTLALSFARVGDLREARKIVDVLNTEFPTHILMQNYSLPSIRAAMKLDQQDADGAIESLRPAIKYDLTYPASFNSLYPSYLRGLAYLMKGDGRSAEVEFQRVVDHPSIVGRYVIGALAHLQLGRAQAMAGEKAAARKSYEDFLTLWKDADSDIPIYQQAKIEFAKLK